jgi:hypothetical protein
MQDSTRYRVTVRGRVTERLATAFGGMRVIHGDGKTIFVGDVEDQAALYGLLNRLRDFGLDLEALERVSE